MATNPHFPDAPAWPEGKPAPLGHNRPPLDEMAREDFDRELLRERPEFLDKLAALEGSADRVVVTDDVTLGRAGDLVNSLRDAQKHVDAVHVSVKKPYLEAGRAVDAKKNDLGTRITAASDKVRRLSNTFLNERAARQRAEAERIAAEQRRQAEEAASAEALRREAADANDVEAMDQVPVIAAPVAAPPKAEPVRSDSGSVVSGKSVWKSQVTDYAAAFPEVSDNPKVQEAIDKAIAGLVRAGKRNIPGVRVWEEQQMMAR